MTQACLFWRCLGCSATYFPERLLCPHCRGTSFETDRVAGGVVEEVTLVRHAIGRSGSDVPVLATVLTDAGHRMIVRLANELSAGTMVSLYEIDSLPHARRLGDEA